MELSSADMPDLQQLKWHVWKELAAGSSPEAQYALRGSVRRLFLWSKDGFSDNFAAWSEGVVRSSRADEVWNGSRKCLRCEVMQEKACSFKGQKVKSLSGLQRWPTHLIFLRFTWRISIEQVWPGAPWAQKKFIAGTQVLKHDALAQLRLSFQWSN